MEMLLSEMSSSQKKIFTKKTKKLLLVVVVVVKIIVLVRVLARLNFFVNAYEEIRRNTKKFTEGTQPPNNPPAPLWKGEWVE